MTEINEKLFSSLTAGINPISQQYILDHMLSSNMVKVTEYRSDGVTAKKVVDNGTTRYYIE